MKRIVTYDVKQGHILAVWEDGTGTIDTPLLSAILGHIKAIGFAESEFKFKCSVKITEPPQPCYKKIWKKSEIFCNIFPAKLVYIYRDVWQCLRGIFYRIKQTT